MKSFKQLFEENLPAEIAIARHFWPARIPAGVYQADRGHDEGDVHVKCCRWARWIRQVVEVKWFSDKHPFTGPHDFPYNQVLFENVDAWEEKDYEVFMYAVCNSKLTHMIQIPVQPTLEHWNIRYNVLDARGVLRDCYQVPVQHVYWKEIDIV